MRGLRKRPPDRDPAPQGGRRSCARHLACGLLCVALGACGRSGTDGSDGAPAGAGGSSAQDVGGTGGTPVAAPSFSDLYRDVLAPSCVGGDSCHSSSNRSGFLSLGTRDEAYTGLVGMLARGSNCRRLEWTRVVPGDPEQSLLLAKLLGTAGCGARMPSSIPLPNAEIDAVRAWIAVGAPDD